MAQKMSRWGVGPLFVLLSVGYSAVIVVISKYYDSIFLIGFMPDQVRTVLGTALIAVGIPFFIASVVMVNKAYNSDCLVTGGVFKCCRHPLYASWAVLMVPGIVLLVNSWLGLTAPVFMYVLLRILVRKEEEYLAEVFGSEYLAYKTRTPCILPYGIFKSS